MLQELPRNLDRKLKRIIKKAFGKDSDLKKFYELSKYLKDQVPCIIYQEKSEKYIKTIIPIALLPDSIRAFIHLTGLFKFDGNCPCVMANDDDNDENFYIFYI
jgi:hypothetical protein